MIKRMCKNCHKRKKLIQMTPIQSVKKIVWVCDKCYQDYKTKLQKIGQYHETKIN